MNAVWLCQPPIITLKKEIFKTFIGTVDPLIQPLFIWNLGIENDCSIRVKMCVLLEYCNEALYRNVWASIIQGARHHP